MKIKIDPRLSVIFVIFIAYALAFVPLYRIARGSAIAFSILPVMTMAWIGGSGAGLLAGLLCIPLNIFLLFLAIPLGMGNLQIREVIASSIIVIIVGFAIGLLRDLGQRLVQANEYLKQLDQTKDDFFSLVTHDLKNPLLSVLGYTDVLLQGMLGEISEKQRGALQTIKREGKVLQNLIESMLDYTRVKFGKLPHNIEEIPLNPLLIELAEEIRPQFDQKKISFELNLPENMVVIKCDKKMVTRVFSNLLGNAAKYTPENGKIVASLTKTGNNLLFSIQDNGIGIPKEHLADIFNKFYIVDPSLPREMSLGLGLYIAKNFVEACGGKIWAESEGPGKGSKFTVEIPPSA